VKPEDATEFKRRLAGVFALYSKDLSDIVLSVWWEAMRPYDFAAVKDALNRHAVNPDNGQFLPKPADVVRLIDGGTQDSALQAWAKVDRAVRQVGTFASVVFDDPLIHRAVRDMGGWVALGTKTEDEWPFVRNHFVTLYRGFRGRMVPVEYPRVLIGIAEATNSSGGYESDPPVLLGDPDAARAVLKGGSDRPALTVTPMQHVGEFLEDRAA
jgi:hypothetical protein